MTQRIKLTEEQFIALTTLMRSHTTSKAYSATYDVLVAGFDISTAGRRNDMSYNQVWGAVKRVEKAMELVIQAYPYERRERVTQFEMGA